MASWTYKCYVDDQKPNLWQKWYDDHPECQGSHDSVFETLEQQTSWRMPGAKPLNGDLIEVRLNGKVKWRIFGFYGGERQKFIVVAIGSHKGPVYSPKDVIKTATKRMKAILSGNQKAETCERPQ